MKVLMVHPHDIGSSLEPWTVRIVRLAAALAARGHQVVLAHFPYEAGSGISLPGIRIVELKRVMSLRAFADNTRALYTLAREVDMVHFQKCQFYAALPSVLAAYMAGKRLHYDWDDWEERIFDRAIEKKGLSTWLTSISFYLLERFLPVMADSISVASRSLEDLALRRGGKRSRVVWIPVGADMRQFHPATDRLAVRKKFGLKEELLVFYHGQLHSCQYGDLFLEVIKIICPSPGLAPMRFMIVGDGTDLNRLKKAAEKLGVSEHVMFTGFVPHEEIAAYIAAADICVAPFEDNEVTRCKSPLKIVEYLASGKPVVASAVGEVPYMLGDAGICVPPGDAEALARGVLQLVADADLRKALSAKARSRAGIFDWDISAQKLEAFYAT
ncbi:MAG: glycosyltransferase family 4 protein [Candidatus Omnitrophota bacterium]